MIAHPCGNKQRVFHLTMDESCTTVNADLAWIPPWLRVPEMQEGAAWRRAGDLAEMFPQA